MRINYQEFRAKYESSGLSIRAFGERRGMSYGMVRYYLKRAESEEGTQNFVELDLSVGREGKYILIKTQTGLEIKIPI